MFSDKKETQAIFMDSPLITSPELMQLYEMPRYGSDLERILKLMKYHPATGGVLLFYVQTLAASTITADFEGEEGASEEEQLLLETLRKSTIREFESLLKNNFENYFLCGLGIFDFSVLMKGAFMLPSKIREIPPATIKIKRARTGEIEEVIQTEGGVENKLDTERVALIFRNASTNSINGVSLFATVISEFRDSTLISRGLPYLIQELSTGYSFSINGFKTPEEAQKYINEYNNRTYRGEKPKSLAVAGDAQIQFHSHDPRLLTEMNATKVAMYQTIYNSLMISQNNIGQAGSGGSYSASETLFAQFKMIFSGSLREIEDQLNDVLERIIRKYNSSYQGAIPKISITGYVTPEAILQMLSVMQTTGIDISKYDIDEIIKENSPLKIKTQTEAPSVSEKTYIEVVNTGQKFNNIAEAAKFFNMKYNDIRDNIAGKTEDVRGLKFIVKKESQDDIQAEKPLTVPGSGSSEGVQVITEEQYKNENSEEKPLLLSAIDEGGGVPSQPIQKPARKKGFELKRETTEKEKALANLEKLSEEMMKWAEKTTSTIKEKLVSELKGLNTSGIKTYSELKKLYKNFSKDFIEESLKNSLVRLASINFNSVKSDYEKQKGKGTESKLKAFDSSTKFEGLAEWTASKSLVFSLRSDFESFAYDELEAMAEEIEMQIDVEVSRLIEEQRIKQVEAALAFSKIIEALEEQKGQILEKQVERYGSRLAGAFREVALNEQPVKAMVRTAIMDSRTCSHCRGLDNEIFYFVEETGDFVSNSGEIAVALPDVEGCEGGLRCRCFYLYEFA